MVNQNKRVIDLTVAEVIEILQQYGTSQSSAVVVDTTKAGSNYTYGLAGIAEIFGCSLTTANRIKQSGKINGAITQVGKLIITDVDKAIALAGNNTKKKIYYEQSRIK